MSCTSRCVQRFRIALRPAQLLVADLVDDSRATTRSSSRTTAAETMPTSASTTPPKAMLTQLTPPRTSRAVSIAKASAAVAEITGTRKDKAESPTSRRTLPGSIPR